MVMRQKLKLKNYKIKRTRYFVSSFAGHVFAISNIQHDFRFISNKRFMTPRTCLSFWFIIHQIKADTLEEKRYFLKNKAPGCGEKFTTLFTTEYFKNMVKSRDVEIVFNDCNNVMMLNVFKSTCKHDYGIRKEVFTYYACKHLKTHSL